jgi:hypothetical protein
MNVDDRPRHPLSAWSREDTDRARIMLRPLANPLPLAFFSFAVGMALLAGLGSGWLSTAQEVRSAGVLMAAFVFPLELVTVVFAALGRDTAVATTLGLYATSWLGLGLLDVLNPTEGTNRSVGVFLAAFTIMLLPLTLSAVLAKPLLAVVLGVSVVRSGLQASYELGGPSWTGVADGITALLVMVAALYAGSAFLIEDMRRRTALMPRRGPAADAVTEEVPEQFRDQPLDPGVREQL